MGKPQKYTKSRYLKAHCGSAYDEIGANGWTIVPKVKN